MTDKELKRLNRAELLQLLMNQSVETEQLQAKVKELTEQVQRNEITCQNAGSLAEAVLTLNGVFQAADQAAQKYIQEMADRAAKQEQELQAKADEAREQVKKLLAEATDSADVTREEADACLAEAKAKAEAMLTEANESAARIKEEAEACLKNARIQAEELLDQARADAQSCKAQAQAESEEFWNQANEKIQTLLQGQEFLRSLFETVGKNHRV